MGREETEINCWSLVLLELMLEMLSLCNPQQTSHDCVYGLANKNTKSVFKIIAYVIFKKNQSNCGKNQKLPVISKIYFIV